MSLAPPGANPSRAGFTLLELLVVLALLAVLAGLVVDTGRRAVELGRISRARAQLAGLSAALESYARARGDYPRTDEPAALLQALIGRRDPAGSVTSGPAVIANGSFATAENRDPWTDATAVLVDPWGRPYRYAYRSQLPWNNPGFVLYSAGPDGVDSPPLLAGGFPDDDAPGNADNLYPNRP